MCRPPQMGKRPMCGPPKWANARCANRPLRFIVPSVSNQPAEGRGLWRPQCKPRTRASRRASRLSPARRFGEVVGPLVILWSADGHDDVLVARRVTLRERLTARWATYRLDKQLARGVAPEAAAPLSLRAQALGEPGVRRSLAGSVRRMVEDACGRRAHWRARVPTVRDQVLAAADELEHLADVLASPGPLAASGLAQARLLLSD